MPERVGPEPQTDHEFIILMYASMRQMQIDLSDLRGEIGQKLTAIEQHDKDEDDALKELQDWRNRILGAFGVVALALGGLIGHAFNIVLGAGR